MVASDAACPDAIARSDAGQLRDCQVQVTLTGPPDLADARFGVKDLDDPDAAEFDFGTTQIKVTPSGASFVTLTATHFGAAGETILGVRTGEALPLRLFVANAAPDLTCTGIVRGGEYICVGCWTTDADTDEVLDAGSISLETTSGEAHFDNLNLPDPAVP